MEVAELPWWWWWMCVKKYDDEERTKNTYNLDSLTLILTLSKKEEEAESGEG